VILEKENVDEERELFSKFQELNKDCSKVYFFYMGPLD